MAFTPAPSLFFYITHFSSCNPLCIAPSWLRVLVSTATVLCKSNANDNWGISCFVLAIYRRYVNKTLHWLPNVKTINQRDIGAIFAISHRDIVLARLRCNDISQSKRYITTIYRCSEVRWAQSSNKWLNIDQTFAFEKFSMLRHN